MTLTEYPTQATPAVVVHNMANRVAAFSSVRPLTNTGERGPLLTRLLAAITFQPDNEPSRPSRRGRRK